MKNFKDISQEQSDTSLTPKRAQSEQQNPQLFAVDNDFNNRKSIISPKNAQFSNFSQRQITGRSKNNNGLIRNDEILKHGLKKFDSASMFDINKTTSKFDEITTIGNSKRHLQYAELLASDVNDQYLRAAFQGDIIQIKSVLNTKSQEHLQSEEFRNKNLLGFFLALMNCQLKTVNVFINKSELLRRIVNKLLHVYDQHTMFANGDGAHSSADYDNFEIQERLGMNDEPKDLTMRYLLNGTYGGPKSTQQQHEIPLDEVSAGFSGRDDTPSLNNQIRAKVKKSKNNSQNKVSQNKKSNKESSSSESEGSEIQVKIQNKVYSKKSGQKVITGVKEIDQAIDIQNSMVQNKQVFSDFIQTGGNSKKDKNVKELMETIETKSFFKTQAELNKFKQVIQSQLSTTFNTNMIKIALNLKEDRVAAVILASFPVTIDENTLNYSIQAYCLNFIHNLFAYDKTEIHLNQSGTLEQVQSKDELNSDDVPTRTFVIDELIQKISDYFDRKESERIYFQILSWKIAPQGNILKKLCELGQERVATHFMNDYPQLSDEEFFLDCINEERAHFLKHALQEQFFDLDYMHNERAIRWIVERIISGQNILFPLNLLLYANFRKWSNELLKDLTNAAALIITIELEKNLLLISHNPIMTLGLMIQYLHQVKNDFNEFDTECHKFIDKFQILGRKIIEKMRFDHVEDIFMDRDFLDRTVLNIITDNNIKPFIVINKLRFLLDKIWDGKESDLIDGKTSHFSKTKYLLHHEIKRLRGVNVTIWDIMGDNFKPNIEEYNFIYQIKFRMQSVQIIFLKDFICATFIICMFQYINYSYLNLFTERKYYQAETMEQKISIVNENMSVYKKFNYAGTILSISYFLNFISRMIYNGFSKKKIPMDIWLFFDFLAGAVNISAFNIIGQSSAESILDVYTKRIYDYYMILVLIISWLRFFSYFLVISKISKITLTLFMMLRETVNFMMILSCYMILMTTVFATLFRDAETVDAKEDYHSLFTTLRGLVDYFLANFGVKQMTNYTTSHSILYIIHVTISNIFLLNFLVAILQTVYDIMIKNGDFYAIEYQYIFITKYMKAMEDDSGYDKLILFPPPLNFLLLPLIIVSPWRSITKRVSQWITYFFFWFENIALVLIFIIYMIAHDPLIMVKTYYQISTKIDGFFSKLYYLIGWTLLGLIYLLYVNIMDTCMLMNILCLENSNIFDQGEEERTKSEKMTFYINKNAMLAIKHLKEIGDSSSILFRKRQNVQRLQTQKMSLKDKIKSQQQEMRNEDIFIVRKELIIAVYEMISAQDPFIQVHRKQQQQSCQLMPFDSEAMSPKTPTNPSNSQQTQQTQNQASPLNKQQQAPDIDLSELINKKKKLNDKDEFQMHPELRNIVSKMMLSRNRENLSELGEYMIREREKMHCYPMSQEEAFEVDHFITKFTILKQNQETNTIDLDLVVKGFPKIINKHTIKKIEMLNFQNMQRVLISFFNDDQDEMFNYYDNRMVRRLDQLREQSNFNGARLDKILDNTKQLYDYISFQQVFAKFYNSIGGNNNQKSSPNPSSHANPAPPTSNLLSPLILEAEQQAKLLLRRQQSRSMKDANNHFRRQQTITNTFLRQGTIGSVASHTGNQEQLRKQATIAGGGAGPNKIGEILKNLYDKHHQLIEENKQVSGAGFLVKKETGGSQDTSHAGSQSPYFSKTTLPKNNASTFQKYQKKTSKMVDNDSDLSHHSKSFAERSPQSEQSEQNEGREIVVENVSTKSPAQKTDLNKSNNANDIEDIFFGDMVERVKLRSITPNQDLQQTQQQTQEIIQHRQSINKRSVEEIKEVEGSLRANESSILVSSSPGTTEISNIQPANKRLSLHQNTFVQQKFTKLNEQPHASAKRPSLFNFNTQIKMGHGLDVSRETLEIPMTAEQVLDQLRAQRREKSADDSNPSNPYDNMTFYDRSGTDLQFQQSIYYPQLQKKQTRRSFPSQNLSGTNINIPQNAGTSSSGVEPQRAQPQLLFKNTKNEAHRFTQRQNNEVKQQHQKNRRVKVVVEDSFKSDTMSDEDPNKLNRQSMEQKLKQRK